MSKNIVNAAVLVAGIAFSGAASATCNNGCPGTPPPTTPPSSSADADAAAKAAAAAQAAAVAQQAQQQKQAQQQEQTQLNKQQTTVGVKTGDTNVGVKTGDTTVKTGDTIVKTGDVKATGGTIEEGAVQNNSTYSNTTTYKAAAASAITSAGGTQGHGCFRGKGAFSIAGQTVAGGVGITIGGGEEYDLVDMTVETQEIGVDGKPTGKTVQKTMKVNPCALDQVNLSIIGAGVNPNATDGQIALAVTTAAEAAPNTVGKAMERVMSDDALVNRFGRKAIPTIVQPVPAPANNYMFQIVGADGKATQQKISCEKGTIPVWDATASLLKCIPG